MSENVSKMRLLTTGDEVLLERFLVRHRDSSMFLRANARRAGLAYEGQRVSSRVRLRTS